MSDRETNPRLEELETDLLLEALLRYYGYDFRDYEPGTVKRRIRESMLAGRISTISRFQDKLLHQPAFLGRFLRGFSSTGLSTFIRIWHAGCSTGEDVYSMAILLHEEGLYQRSRIYATDLSEDVVKQARIGRFRSSVADQYSSDYKKAGGTRSLLEYFRKKGNRLLIEPALKRNIVFSEHNLATDGSFNEFQVIVCRGILWNFNHRLRERVDKLIYDSLSRFGVLALGPAESLETMPYEDHYALLDEGSRLYQKHGTNVSPRFAGMEGKHEKLG